MNRAVGLWLLRWCRLGVLGGKQGLVWGCALLLALEAGAGELVPGTPVEYRSLAFRPDQWREQGVSTQLVPWTGRRVVLLTATADLDREVMATFVSRLDGGWELYREIVGASPRLNRHIGGLATIAAVPKTRLTCGVGCGYVGLTGIEVEKFYGEDYPMVSRSRKAFPHYYFYEMGRNYYLFGERHSVFTTGYAVFMRYVCMDTLGCVDADARTREVIDRCIGIYAKSELPFLETFANLEAGEKSHRLRDENGRRLVPSDQPVMYASAMLYLRRKCGGNAWLTRFYEHLRHCPPVPAGDDRAGQARKQSISWLVAASAAAGQDLSPLFVDRWRLPVSPELRRELARTRWHSRRFDMERLFQKLGRAKIPDLQ